MIFDTHLSFWRLEVSQRNQKMEINGSLSQQWHKQVTSISKGLLVWSDSGLPVGGLLLCVERARLFSNSLPIQARARAGRRGLVEP